MRRDRCEVRVEGGRGGGGRGIGRWETGTGGDGEGARGGGETGDEGGRGVAPSWQRRSGQGGRKVSALGMYFQRGHGLSSSGYLNMNLTRRTNSDMICAKEKDW